MNEVARIFGQGATYDAVEGQLRKAKKLATQLKDEAVGRVGPVKAASRAKNGKALDGAGKLSKSRDSWGGGKSADGADAVKGARVTKTKRSVMPKIKHEQSDLDEELFKLAAGRAGDDGDEDEMEV